MSTNSNNSPHAIALSELDLAYIQAAEFGDFARAAAPNIVHRLRTATISIRKVLDVGCGAGILTQALINAGFNVTAIDTSTELLRWAQITAPRADFVHASAYEVEIRDYDAVIALGEALTYHTDCSQADDRIRRFLQNVAVGLPPSGMLIFDVIGLGEPSLTGRTWSAGDDWAVLVETTDYQAERTLVRAIDVFRSVAGCYRRSKEVHTACLFDVEKLRNLLVSIGFTVETADCYGVHPLPFRRHAFFATRL